MSTVVDGNSGGTALTTTYLRPGMIAQRVCASNTSTASMTNFLPADDTPPLITEGTQIHSGSITPISVTNNVNVRLTAFVSSQGAADQIGMSLYRNTHLIGATWGTTAGATNYLATLYLEVEDNPANVSAQLYTVRVGGNGTNTVLNGAVGTRYGAGYSKATMVLEEIVR